MLIIDHHHHRSIIIIMAGEGATVYCLGPGADNKDSDLVTSLFSSVGLCTRVQESQIGETKAERSVEC